ncbi:probable RNA methyltransferase CG1239 [Scaptodrosophila lebanonensis]|uniref:RNA methyltransferase n=1 Tax=Drosophila lebanonensis TaxID=7225 RepID=A0A6J2TKJ8_DROLE|nr:probable RNA methyltransferase CG1239 [Scaptodrosophila lebanonensis]
MEVETNNNNTVITEEIQKQNHQGTNSPIKLKVESNIVIVKSTDGIPINNDNAEKRKETNDDNTKEAKRLKLHMPATEDTEIANKVDNLESSKLADKLENIAKTQSTSIATAVQKKAPQSPKKRLQLDANNADSDAKKRRKQTKYMYGNYKNYYGKRFLDNVFHDIRLDVIDTHKELFKDKILLDIGSNTGHLTIEIAKRYGVKSLVGLDIDRKLIKIAQTQLNILKQKENATTSKRAENKFPFNVKFIYGNYVLDDDVLLEVQRPKFDVILCLSVTKWIHLQFGDAGLKQAFRRMFLQLLPGGKLILEPQAFQNYKRRKAITEQIRQHYNAIKFFPTEFTEYLLSPEVGFSKMELMGVPKHCEVGFTRPIQIFHKD